MLNFAAERRLKAFIATIFCFYQSMPYLCFCTALQETALPVRTQMRKLPRSATLVTTTITIYKNKNNVKQQKSDSVILDKP
jgi:hypothetical protein